MFMIYSYIHNKFEIHSAKGSFVIGVKLEVIQYRFMQQPFSSWH